MDFWEAVFGAEERGYIRVALNSKNKKFNQQFIQWPTEKEKLQQLLAVKDRGDLYFSPALFKTESGNKAAVLGARVGWVDCDTALQSTEPQPSIVVESGSPQRTHLYFNLPQLVDPSTVEKYNRYLTTLYRGDNSGWDANQLLRVPGTLNYKTDPPRQVKLKQLTSSVWTPPELPDSPESKLQIEVVSAAETLLNRNLSPTIRTLLSRHPIECFDRSASLFYLGRLAAEAGLSSGEIYGLLEYADNKWGKFSKRDDKELRLTELVTRVLEGQVLLDSPIQPPPEEQDNRPKPIGWFNLSKSERKIEWVIDGLVRQGGMTLIAGDTGVGKSTLALSLAAKVAVGASNFLGNEITRKEQKVLYSSLEMDEFELTEFIAQMSSELQGCEDKLNERALLLPVGHTIPLDLESGQRFYEHLLDADNYTGLVIDTLGASTSSSLSDEKPMRAICDWIDRARKKYGIWVVVLHHPRKEASTSRKKQERTMDDIYGARIIGDRANVVLLLEKTGKRNMSLTNKKSRFREGGETTYLYRTTTGWIEKGSVSDEGVEFTSPLPNEPKPVVPSNNDLAL